MKMLDPHPEPVPLEEVAAVLAHAAARVPGGPPAMITASGRQLAAALQDAGYRVVRDQAPTCQLTLEAAPPLPKQKVSCFFFSKKKAFLAELQTTVGIWRTPSDPAKAASPAATSCP